MFILSARRDLGFAGLSRRGAPAGSCGLSARFSTISSEQVQIEGMPAGHGRRWRAASGSDGNKFIWPVSLVFNKTNGRSSGG